MNGDSTPPATPAASTSRNIDPNMPGPRVRPPPPRSPLSRMTSPDQPAQDPSSPPGIALSPPAMVPAHQSSSPCFIHSGLNRNGTLQDRLQHNKAESSSGQGGPSHGQSHSHTHHSHVSSPAPHHTHKHHHPVHFNHPQPPAHARSPPNRTPFAALSLSKDRSYGGFESDRSASTSLSGSALFDGDGLDDEEEGGSLTRQLAETAQGVREMSKELGRTRVRSKVQHILIVTKARDNRLIKLTRELALYLMQKRPASSPEGSRTGATESRTTNGDRGMVVYVDAQLKASKRFDAAGLQRDYPDLFRPVYKQRSSSSASLSPSTFSSTTSINEMAKRNKDEGQLRYWTSEMCSNSSHLFDFVVTLGGDGTVLFTSWLFQRIVPPVLPFALGSLGFLTNFDFARYKHVMDNAIDDGIRVNLRMRFTCTVYRAIAPEEAAAAEGGKKRKAIKRPGGEILINQVDKEGWAALEGHANGPPPQPCKGAKDKEIMCYITRPVEQFEVLNDLVVDRGPSPFVSLLELFGDEQHLTTVQADGLTVSTPTGSTAYSLSAGGSLVHPQIPAILITPICPHTLSFRPMLLPDSMELRICVPYNSRSTAWASFDGRGRVELKQGDHIKVTASKYPFPTVCADKASTDWFSSISRTLRWNEREKQKSFVVVEEDNEPSKSVELKQQTKALMAAGKKAGESPSIRRSNRDGQFNSDDTDRLYANLNEEEGEEEYDIDERSGTTTPCSPSMETLPAKKNRDRLQGQRSGVDTPDRFVTPYTAPPPLSQRHLVEALTQVEIQEKENESGQRDDIRSDGAELRVNRGHLDHQIPTGRTVNPITPIVSNGKENGNGNEKSSSSLLPEVKRVKSSKRSGKSKKCDQWAECKAKAFAFFGQDDESGSDGSDDDQPE